MNNSFELLSTMSPKIKKKYTNNVVYPKMPTKLALKKNIRRSSISTSLHPTAHNNSIILIEATTTDASNCNRSHSRLSIINSTHITISDSESCDSKNGTSSIRNKVHNIQTDYGLSVSKYNAIDKWISNVYPVSSKEEITKKDQLHQQSEGDKRWEEFEKNLNTKSEKKQTVEKQLTNNDKDNNKLLIVKNDNIYNENHASNMVPLINKTEDSVNSSSDIIEDSDDNSGSKSSLLKISTPVYLQGQVWKTSTNILLPRSEPRFKKKNTNPFTVVPRTEVKTKARSSIVHKNPCLGFNQISQETPIMQPKPPVDMPWSQRLQALCDTDSSDDSFTHELSKMAKNTLAIRLFPLKEMGGNKDSSDNKLGQVSKVFKKTLKDTHEKLEKNEFDLSTDSEKENFSDFSISSETLEDKVRKKMLSNKQVEQITSRKIESLEKDYDNNVEEYFSDSSNDCERLEDKFKRKLRFYDKTKRPVSRDKNLKKNDILKDILNVEFDTNCKKGITNEVPNKTDNANFKLKKKTNVYEKKKNTIKSKIIKNKVSESSEDGFSNTKPSSNHIKLSKDLEKEYLSDSSFSETLEDKLKRKLILNENRMPANTNEKFLDNFEDILKSILDDNNLPKDTDLDSIKLKKKGNIYPKKKNTIKAKTVKQKPPLLSEDSDLDRKPKKENHQKFIALDNSQKNSANVKSFLASLSGCVPLSECDASARIFRNNFKLYKNTLVKKLFDLYNEKIFNNAIPEDTLIEWSERMRGTAGYCYCKKITHTTGVIDRKARIVLASKVLDCTDRLRDTLLHEMCHAATWIVNEVSDGHGNYWKAWVRKARETFPELPPIKVCHSYAITTKYTYKCVKCGYSFGRHTKSIDIQKNRCGRCYGAFEILINKTTKGGETLQVRATPKKQPTGFALFVKENYANYKSPQLNHGQVMKLLGQKFTEMKVSIENNEKA